MTVDCVVFGLDGRALDVLLIRRGHPPFRGRWALPGGFVDPDEGLETAARRELLEETGICGLPLEQLHAFGEPGRDPRGHTVSVVYYGLVRPAEHPAAAADDASDARWFPAADPPALAFDHRDVLLMALRRLRAAARSRPVGLELLARSFTLSELQALYETILQTSVDRRRLRKALLSAGLLVELAEPEGRASRRRERRYRFDRRLYRRLTENGMHLDA